MPVRFLFILICISFSVSARDTPTAAANPEYQQWIEAMKTRPRGPFKELRWFCNDGTVLPPKAYACVDHGGGYQHGAWSKHTLTLREHGYKIANLLAGYNPEAELEQADFIDAYNQLLIEKYLVAADDGWIFREALFYRGAIQEEDEREGGRKLLLALSGKPEWISSRYPALRIGAVLVSHGESTASVQKVRQVSAALSDQDSGFNDLRGKIHGTPDAGDAQRVRDYAAGVSDPAMQAKYEELAIDIDLVYQGVPLPQKLRESAKVFSGGPWLQEILRDSAAELEKDPAASNRYQVTAHLLAKLRDALPRIKSASARLRVIDLGLDVETENFSSSAELREQLATASRHQHIIWLGAAVDAAYGTGAINARGRKELQKSLAGIEADRISLS
ncbi:MAG: pyruvate phosphate dikinase, partial [Gammaproteobacteria bacterium]|nr:pyruvate phosphate dikinase [Gammaproteobacteria bacterium]